MDQQEEMICEVGVETDDLVFNVLSLNVLRSGVGAV